MPITGKLTSVTAYSNSIRENILLASLLFEWVKKDKRGARESRAGSRILRFRCILEPQIRFRTSPNRNERYRALAVPCILDKIIYQNGLVGSLLRFRFSGEDALKSGRRLLGPTNLKSTVGQYSRTDHTNTVNSNEYIYSFFFVLYWHRPMGQTSIIPLAELVNCTLHNDTEYILS